MDPKVLKTFKQLGDLYKVLHIEPTDDKKVIEKAYKRQALVWHPDKNKSPAAPDMFHKIKQAHEILLDEDLKAQFDKYKNNQKAQEERTSKQTKERRRYADDLLAKEKASQGAQDDQPKKISKEEQKREESKRMKREWEEEEEKRKQELDKKKAEKVESKEFTMVKIKWPENNKMTYTADILKIIFGKYGEIKDVVVFPKDNKAMIEFKFRLSAEKAYQDNKTKEKEKRGFDDGLRVSLMVKGKEKDGDPAKGNPTKVLVVDSNNIQKISNVFNRDSTILLGPKEMEDRRTLERQKLIESLLAKEGLL